MSAKNTKFKTLTYKVVGRTIIVMLEKEKLTATIADKEEREAVKKNLENYKKKPSMTSLAKIDKTFRAKKEEVSKKVVKTKAATKKANKAQKKVKKAVSKDKSIKTQILEINASSISEEKKAEQIMALYKKSQNTTKVPSKTTVSPRRGEH